GVAGGGGGMGMVVGGGGVKMRNSTLPPNLLPIPEVGVDATVLLYATGVTLATGLLFGLAPSWRSAAADVHDALKQAGRSSGGAARPWLRNGLAGAGLARGTGGLIGARPPGQTPFPPPRAPPPVCPR